MEAREDDDFDNVVIALSPAMMPKIGNKTFDYDWLTLWRLGKKYQKFKPDMIAYKFPQANKMLRAFLTIRLKELKDVPWYVYEAAVRPYAGEELLFLACSTTSKNDTKYIVNGIPNPNPN